MTPQQQKIIAHIEARPGLTAKEIALLVQTTPSTVECQIHRIVKSGRLILVNGYVVRHP